METATRPSTLTLASATAVVLHDGRAVLGESPVHDGRTGAIYYVDIEGRKVVILPGGFGGERERERGEGEGREGREKRASLTSHLTNAPVSSPHLPGDDGTPATSPISIPTPLPGGGVTPPADPASLLGSQPDAGHLLNLATRTLGPPLASIPPNHALPGTRFNDGLASPQGTWVGGRLHKDWREGRRGRVYALVFGDGAETEGARPDAAAPPRAASLVPVLEESEVGMANGMAWGDGGAAFYLADSASKCVLRFEADPASGIPRSGTGRVVVSASTLGGAVPDGLCLDDAGRLWVALAETGAVGVFEPGEGGGGGREVGRVQGLPLTRLTSVAWGMGVGVVRLPAASS